MTLIMQVALLVHLTLVTSAEDSFDFVIETSSTKKEPEIGEDYRGDYATLGDYGSLGDYSRRNNEKNSTDYVAAVVAANEQFSQRMFHSQLIGSQENYVISPSSISTVLTMVAVGARGKALLQLQQGLSLPMQGT